MNFLTSRKGYYFLLGSLGAFGTLIAALASSFQGKNPSNVVEAEKLIIKNPSGKGMIELGFNQETPYIAFLSGQGKTMLKLEGGDVPAIVLSNPEEKAALKMMAKDGSGKISVHDAAGESRIVMNGGKTPDITMLSPNNQVIASLEAPGNGAFAQFKLSDGGLPRVQMQGGSTPGLFLMSDKNKTIASWTVLTDGGGGLGLADASGNAATILRGGLSPSVSFFSPQNEPMAALGVIQKVPHLLISGPVGNEGILIHGGTPSSMVVVDEAGKVKILISKHGVFQGKEEGKETGKKKDNKVFSFDDQKTLFPDFDGNRDDSIKR